MPVAGSVTQTPPQRTQSMSDLHRKSQTWFCWKLCRVVKPVPSVLMANTVPPPPSPPPDAVPYRVWPDTSNSACGLAPSLQVKLCRVVNAVPSVVTAKTVPAPKLPPPSAVPYSVLPDEFLINPPFGSAPSLLV